MYPPRGGSLTGYSAVSVVRPLGSNWINGSPCGPWWRWPDMACVGEGTDELSSPEVDRCSTEDACSTEGAIGTPVTGACGLGCMGRGVPDRSCCAAAGTSAVRTPPVAGGGNGPRAGGGGGGGGSSDVLAVFVARPFSFPVACRRSSPVRLRTKCLYGPSLPLKL